ncbi:MAG: tetraacyldisaccharide 4'-kinase [Candidatus Neomarinimicrobiota bacterium]
MSAYNYINNPHYRIFLFPLALFYWGLMFWRNLFYNIGVFVSHSLPCKVISIGNMTTGGTGKTPAVIYFAKLLKKNGKRVAVLSRGYGRSTTGTIVVSTGNYNIKNWQLVGDEPALLAEKLPDIPLVVDENRYRGGVYITKHFNPDVIILDDGFQHRTLDRDLDIVLLNSNQSGIAYKLLPYGLLREPWHHLKRADITILTKNNIKRPSHFIYNKLKSLKIVSYNSKIMPSESLIGTKGNIILVNAMQNERTIAVSGIGDPSGFELLLKKLCLNVIDHISFDDHHHYDKEDLKIIKTIMEKQGARFIITTEKDLIKLRTIKHEICKKVYALPIQFSLSKKGQRAILNKLDFN